MKSTEGVGPEASKKGIVASANSSAPDNLGEPAFNEARSDSGSQSTGVSKSSEMMKSQMEESRTDEGNEEVRRAWPPKKEELEQLYLAQRLSAMKISRIYGLKYPNPKSGESMVLWYLKKFGIKRRDKTEHARKVTEEMVDQWISRYQKGESLKRIAGEEFSPVTVFLHLRRRGVTLRDKVEAQIKAVTKYARTPFSGELTEKAYLLGFAWGDLHVSRHGRAVRIKTATTHPALIELIKNCFGRYGQVTLFPRESKLAGFEWSVQADLDRSFEFLLEKYGPVPSWVTMEDNVFRYYLAGLFDAEGSISLLESTFFGFQVAIANKDASLIQTVFGKMVGLRFDPRLKKQKGSEVWSLYMWQAIHVRRFLTTVCFIHREKRTRAKLALLIQDSSGTRREELLEEWDQLRASFKKERDMFVEEAKRALGRS